MLDRSLEQVRGLRQNTKQRRPSAWLNYGYKLVAYECNHRTRSCSELDKLDNGILASADKLL